MKYFVKDEMNIKDIATPLDLSKILYNVNLEDNIIEANYTNEPFFEIITLDGIDAFNNEYVILAIDEDDEKIYMKEILIKEN